MEALLNLARRAQSLSSGLVFMAVFNDPEIQDLVIELNTEGQLGVGIASDGGPMNEYSFASIELFDKPSIGPDNNTQIRLYDTGAYWQTYHISTVTDNYITIDADGGMYGGDLNTEHGRALGLSPESIEKLNDTKVIEFIIAYVQEYLLQDNR